MYNSIIINPISITSIFTITINYTITQNYNNWNVPKQEEYYSKSAWAFTINSDKKKRGFKNVVDKAFLDYFKTKGARALSSSDQNNQDSKTEALKMFLHSMLSDLLKMSDEGIRLFKRKALQTVDDILSHSLEFTPWNTFPSSFTPSTHSEVIFIPQDANMNNTTVLWVN